MSKEIALRIHNEWSSRKKLQNWIVWQVMCFEQNVKPQQQKRKLNIQKSLKLTPGPSP